MVTSLGAFCNCVAKFFGGTNTVMSCFAILDDTSATVVITFPKLHA